MFARWAYSPATKKRQRDDEFASQAFVLTLLIGGVAAVFWQQLIGAAVFIGETDRLNTYLSVRLAEYDALRTYGRVPAWNPTMFGGFSVAALHWMNPGTDPIAFFLQRFHPYTPVDSPAVAAVLAVRDLLAELKTLRSSSALAWPSSARALLIALGIILVAAVLSWLIHGPIFDQLVQNTPFRTSPPAVVLPHPPDLIVLPIAVKVVMTAAILALVLAALLRRPSPGFDGRIVATLVVATFAFVETVTYAHFKVDGPQNWTYPVPFSGSNYMDVPPSVMRPPSEEKLKAFAEKVEIVNFRSMLVTERSFYARPLTPHISQFWRARLAGGYGTGVPDRLARLPWPEGVSTLRAIELWTELATNPYLLSLLNVKYQVFVTPDLYFNTASKDVDKLTATLRGAAVPTEIVNVEGISFGLLTNPHAPLPRHFLVPSVTGVREIPRLQADAFEAQARSASENQDEASASAVFKRGINELAWNSLAENFLGTQAFDTSGSLDVAYHADVIDVRVTPSTVNRFLVINERYHPDWRARAQVEDIPIFPTNAVMMGVRIPPNSIASSYASSRSPRHGSRTR